MSRFMFEHMVIWSADVVLQCIDDGFPEVLYLNQSIPLWDDLTEEEKINAIHYVRDNKYEEDFSHSECCKSIHQATAFFLVEFFKDQDAEVFFDDLDFLLVKTGLPKNYKIKKDLGISEDFFD